MQILAYNGEDLITAIDTVKSKGINYMSLNPCYKEAVFTQDSLVRLWHDAGSVTTVCNDWNPRFQVLQDLRTVSEVFIIKFEAAY